MVTSWNQWNNFRSPQSIYGEPVQCAFPLLTGLGLSQVQEVGNKSHPSISLSLCVSLYLSQPLYISLSRSISLSFYFSFRTFLSLNLSLSLTTWYWFLLNVIWLLNYNPKMCLTLPMNYHSLSSSPWRCQMPTTASVPFLGWSPVSSFTDTHPEFPV